MNEIVKVVSRTIGELVYHVTYVPLWLAWNLLGKHIWRTFLIIFAQTDEDDAKDEAQNLTFCRSRLEARRYLASAYYTFLQTQRA